MTMAFRFGDVLIRVFRPGCPDVAVEVTQGGKVTTASAPAQPADPAQTKQSALSPTSGHAAPHSGAEKIHSHDLPGDAWFAGPGGNQARPYSERTGDSKGVRMRYRGAVDRKGSLHRIDDQSAATSCGVKPASGCGCNGTR